MNLETSAVRSRLAEHTAVLTSLAEFSSRENVQLYLVGGTVRDLLMGRITGDLDFAIYGDAISFARKFADHINARSIPLDEEQDTARVVCNKGKLVMDFTRIHGSDIREDLTARDFTINAMAIDFRQVMGKNMAEVIDPYGGVDDLNNKLIRLASAQSIKEDPVRMLRAYRFAATLDFMIELVTVSIIQDSVSLLNVVSAERVRDELFKILEVRGSAYYLKAMDSAGLLERVFPEMIPMKGMEQNEYHHLDAWCHSMLTLEFFEQDPIPGSLNDRLSEVEEYLEYEFVKDRPRRSLLKLAALLHDIGKPARKTIDEHGRTRFFNHQMDGAAMVTDIGTRLKLANRETSSLAKVVEYHMYPLGLCVHFQKPIGARDKDRALRRFIQNTGSDWLAILMISFADLRATQGPWRKAEDLSDLDRLIGKIASIYFQEVQSPMPKLVTGDDLMEEFKLPATPIIGELLEQVREAQINGTIKTRDDAIAFVRSILSRRNAQSRWR